MALLRDNPTTRDGLPSGVATKASLAMSTLALMLSGFAVLEIVNEPDLEQLDRRIACLEKSGVNECGVEGR